jgi:hypothetical protein
MLLSLKLRVRPFHYRTSSSKTAGGLLELPDVGTARANQTYLLADQPAPIHQPTVTEVWRCGMARPVFYNVGS